MSASYLTERNPYTVYANSVSCSSIDSVFFTNGFKTTSASPAYTAGTATFETTNVSANALRCLFPNATTPIAGNGNLAIRITSPKVKNSPIVFITIDTATVGQTNIEYDLQATVGTTLNLTLRNNSAGNVDISAMRLNVLIV